MTGSDWQSPFEDNIPFDYALISPDSRIAAAVQHLMALPELCIGRNATDCLTLIVNNLVMCSKHGAEKRVSYHRSHGFYSSSIMKNKHLNPQGIGRQGFIRCVDTLAKLGFIDKVRGLHKVEGSFVGRMWPIDKFIEGIIKPFELHEVSFKIKQQAPIVVKDENKKDVTKRHSEAPAFIDMASRVKAYNKCYRDDVEISFVDQRYGFITPESKYLHRVFNADSLNKGGRLYGAWWQSISGADRKTILINGESTVELDYAGNHIGLLYGMIGSPMPEVLRNDPYFVRDPDHRAAMKLCILRSLNNPSKAAAWQSVNRERYKTAGKSDDMPLSMYEDLLAEFFAKHPTIEPLFFQPDQPLSLTLQYLDSTVTDAVLDQLMIQQGIPVLPIHDSFIVRARDKGKLLEAMRLSYVNSNNPVVKSGYTSIKNKMDGSVYLFNI